MPWHVRRDASACSASEPWAVVGPGGEVVGCHASKAKARKHQAALYANTHEGGSLRAYRRVADGFYSEDQPRDDHGRWTGSGDSGTSDHARGGSGTERPNDVSYRGLHQPNLDGPPANDLLAGGMMPNDVYAHPDYYTGTSDRSQLAETMAQLRAARGSPDAAVTVYRSAPADVTQINHGDWVSLSRGYAADSGKHPTDPAKDMPVLSARVPARDVRFAGDDLMEWGYAGPGVRAKGFASSSVGKSTAFKRVAEGFYSEDQPRVPPGEPGGGQWVGANTGGNGGPAASEPTPVDNKMRLEKTFGAELNVDSL